MAFQSRDKIPNNKFRKSTVEQGVGSGGAVAPNIKCGGHDVFHLPPK